ncbi:unnamed protein product [Allacma fusca]|uniref:Biogenesis of lysosome-related organelles complex 1 subunit 5 n=1 Tax=Allacma fusca TaxID=39272 RepID=A0A8J2PLP4_9HEXA|nr:unnamed protein product [Allacma fusca]
MTDGAVKDASEIYSSIFDHSPLTRKEIEYFVREFEDTRGDREVDYLFKILEKTTELKDTEITKVKSLADIHLPKLSAELQVAESISKKLLQKAESSDKVSAARLEQKRSERAAEWDAFVHDMTKKCIRIDNAYKAKEDEVRDLYQKAEVKLLASNPGEFLGHRIPYRKIPFSESVKYIGVG